MLKLYDLSIDLAESPLCAHLTGTRFSWKLESDRQATKQTSYRIIISWDLGDFYDSGVIESDRSVEVSCPDLTLLPATAYTLSLTVTDNHGESATAKTVFATELPAEMWQGKWVKPQKHIAGNAPYLRKKFTVEKPVKRAMLYASGLGCAEYYLNGQRIGEDYIDPPQTNYEREVFYRVYDLTDKMAAQNCFAALLGDGWYSQSRVWSHKGFKYGDVCLCAELHIDYMDGDSDLIATDESWTSKYSPILLNNLYGGETYDTRFETPDFAYYEGDEEDWKPCRLDDIPKGSLVPCLMPPVRIIREIPAVSVTNASGKQDGAWIIDMGENFAGFAEFHLPPCAEGSQYVFRFAETVNEGGALDMRSMGAFATQCIQQDVYIARGDPQGEVWRPRFTYHGFRYIEVTGYFDLRKYGMDPDLGFATGYAISTDLKPQGQVSVDNADLSKLQKIVLNTFLSNYHGIPEDCPAREKCGWLGDAQIVCNTAIMNFDMRAAYEKYLHDIRTTTEVYGRWNMISPGKRDCGEASPLWGCAQVIVPYWMYKYYGDEHVVRSNFDLMEKWVAHELARSEDLVIDVGLGDWCVPGGNNHPRRIPVKHSSTMMFFEIADKMSELCRDLGYGKEKATYYADLADRIKESLIRNFYNAEKHSYGYHASDAVALMLGIYPEGDKAALFSALIASIEEEHYEMHTGIYGNKYLIPILCEGGMGDMALRFLLNRDSASFGTMMDDHATTLWECLDSFHIMPRERSVSSYNHPMQSGFAYFYYAHIGGISPLSPGFKRFAVKPTAFTDIGEAEVTHSCPYGEIKLSYRRKEGKYTYALSIPVGTTCLFTPIGAYAPMILESGDYTF